MVTGAEEAAMATGAEEGGGGAASLPAPLINACTGGKGRGVLMTTACVTADMACVPKRRHEGYVRACECEV